MTLAPLTLDEIRSMLADRGRRRPPAARGLPGVRVMVDGRPAVVYVAQHWPPPTDVVAVQLVRLIRERHAGAQPAVTDPNAWRYEPGRRRRTEANLERLRLWAGLDLPRVGRITRVGAR